MEEQAEEQATVSQLEHAIRKRALTAWLMAPNEPEVVEAISSLNLGRPEWHIRAACRGADTALFLSGRGRSASTAAIAICAGCVVRDECLDYAMSDIELVGVWGGTTTEERRQLRRRGQQPRAGRQPRERSRIDHHVTRAFLSGTVHFSADPHASPQSESCLLSRYAHIRPEWAALLRNSERTAPEP